MHPSSGLFRSPALRLALGLLLGLAATAPAQVPATPAAEPARDTGLLLVGGGSRWLTVALGGADDYLGGAVIFGHEQRGARRGIRPTFLGRYVQLEEFCLYSCPDPGQYRELAGLVGVTAGGHWLAFTAASGLAWVSGRPLIGGPTDSPSYSAVAVPVLAELAIRPFSMVGLDVSAGTTVGANEAPLYLLVGLQFGSLRPRR